MISSVDEKSVNKNCSGFVLLFVVVFIGILIICVVLLGCLILFVVVLIVLFFCVVVLLVWGKVVGDRILQSCGSSFFRGRY